MKKFIWYFYTPQTVNYVNIKNSSITRAFYLATYMNYDNDIPHNKNKLKEILLLKDTDFRDTLIELTNHNILLTRNDKYSINSDMFFKGYLKSIATDIKIKNKNCIKVDIDEMQHIYKNCLGIRQHKIIGYILKLIPYCNGNKNNLTINNHNAEWRDIAQIVDYDIKNLNRLKCEINKYSLIDGSPILLQIGDEIMLNPNLVSREVVLKEFPMDLESIQLKINKIRSNNDESIFNYLINIKDTNYYKIGCTSNIEKRLLSLQTSTPSDLEVTHTFIGGYKTEYYLQQVFKNYQIKNEWFELEENHIELIKKLI